MPAIRRRFYGAVGASTEAHETGHRRAFSRAHIAAQEAFRVASARLNFRKRNGFAGKKKTPENKTRDPLPESRDSIKTE